jgi:hypothetical protein
VYDNSYRLKYRRSGADIEDVVVYVRKTEGQAELGEGAEGRDGDEGMGMKLSRYNEGLKGLPIGWEVSVREEE